jgi:hypothetical protein
MVRIGYRLYNQNRGDLQEVFVTIQQLNFQPDLNLERAKGFEPSTPTLARLCSTPELRPLPGR